MNVKKAGLTVGLIKHYFLPGKRSTAYLFGLVMLIFIGCGSNHENNPGYYQGEPVILKKEYSLIPGVCMYTYEGYGKKETFEDKCEKFSVGDKLGVDTQSITKDTLNKNKE